MSQTTTEVPTNRLSHLFVSSWHAILDANVRFFHYCGTILQKKAFLCRYETHTITPININIRPAPPARLQQISRKPQ
jgi:hypothetical protein